MKRIAVVGHPGTWSTEQLADAVAAETGFRCIVDPVSIRLDLDAGRVTADGHDLTSFDAVILKKIGRRYTPDDLDRLEILRFLNERGVPVFSKPESVIRVIDRLACTVTLRLHDIPMPPTVITEETDAAVEAVGRFERAVLKPLFSTKARGMEVVEADQPDLREVIERFRLGGNTVMYVQKMMELPGRDLGVAFLGGGYVGTYARVGGGDAWSTSTHTGGRYENHEPSEEIVDLARRAEAPFSLAFTCVDVAETEAGPVVLEVSAFGGFRGLLDGSGIEAARLYTQYVLDAVAHVELELPSADALREDLTGRFETPWRVGLDFDGCRLELRTNARPLAERLAFYYKDFLAPAVDPAFEITAIDAPVREPDLPFADRPLEPGKTRVKEELVELPGGGRLVRKRLTGMLMLVGRRGHVVYGPCLDFDNQVINFVNARHIQWRRERGDLLCHAAAVARAGRGVALAASPGGGKSTLALHAMATGCDFVSNDRVLIERTGTELLLRGVAKLPRVNPGTVLHNPALTDVMPAEARRAAAELAPEALWNLEEKYDVFLDQCFGPGRFALRAAATAIVILDWRREAIPPRLERVDLAARPDLLAALMKSAGPLAEPPDGALPPPAGPAYVERIADCPVYEIGGGVDFAWAAGVVRRLLDGREPIEAAARRGRPEAIS